MSRGVFSCARLDRRRHVWRGASICRVLDGFLLDETLQLELADLRLELNEETGRGVVWRAGEADRSSHVPEALLAFARAVVDAAGAADHVSVLECWTNTLGPGGRVGFHFDKDERLYRTNGIVVAPYLVAVYYPLVEYLAGGELALPREVVMPCSNRLVMFSGKVPHEVRVVEAGVRHSVVLDAWLANLALDHESRS